MTWWWRRDRAFEAVVISCPGVGVDELMRKAGLSAKQVEGSARRLKRRKRIIEVDSRDFTTGGVRRIFFTLPDIKG